MGPRPRRRGRFGSPSSSAADELEGSWPGPQMGDRHRPVAVAARKRNVPMSTNPAAFLPDPAADDVCAAARAQGDRHPRGRPARDDDLTDGYLSGHEVGGKHRAGPGPT